MKDAGSDELFEFISYLSERSDPSAWVFLTDKPDDIKRRFISKDKEIYIICTRWQLITKRREFLSLPEQNIQLISLHRLTDKFLEDKLVVCLDYLESKPFHLLSPKLYKLLNRSMCSIVRSQKTWFWKIKSLKLFARRNNSALTGSMPNREQELISIGGKLVDISGASYPLLPILAIITQFNEGDIIGSVITHLLNQGVDIHIIDNWSDDGSFELITELAAQNPGRVSLERFPTKDSHKYEWSRLLERVTAVARENINEYKWIISNDADEIRWSPWPGVTIQKAISFADYLGYNCIDYTVFNFSPTEDGYDKGTDPVSFFRYGRFGNESWHFLQLKTWRNNSDAEIAESGGHLVEFPGRKIYPIKFLLGHYSLRSSKQAKRKIFKDRRPRFIETELNKGWHVQYNNSKDRQSFIVSSRGLVDYKDRFNEKYLLQRVSGVGLKQE